MKTFFKSRKSKDLEKAAARERQAAAALDRIAIKGTRTHNWDSTTTTVAPLATRPISIAGGPILQSTGQVQINQTQETAKCEESEALEMRPSLTLSPRKPVSLQDANTNNAAFPSPYPALSKARSKSGYSFSSSHLSQTSLPSFAPNVAVSLNTSAVEPLVYDEDLLSQAMGRFSENEVPHSHILEPGSLRSRYISSLDSEVLPDVNLTHNYSGVSGTYAAPITYQSMGSGYSLDHLTSLHSLTHNSFQGHDLSFEEDDDDGASSLEGLDEVNAYDSDEDSFSDQTSSRPQSSWNPDSLGFDSNLCHNLRRTSQIRHSDTQKKNRQSVGENSVVSFQESEDGGWVVESRRRKRDSSRSIEEVSSILPKTSNSSLSADQSITSTIYHETQSDFFSMGGDARSNAQIDALPSSMLLTPVHSETPNTRPNENVIHSPVEDTSISRTLSRDSDGSDWSVHHEYIGRGQI